MPADNVPTIESPYEEKEAYLNMKWAELSKIADDLGCSYTSFFSYGPIVGMIVNNFRKNEDPPPGRKIVIVP